MTRLSLSAENRIAFLYALPFLAHALAMTPLITLHSELLLGAAWPAPGLGGRDYLLLPGCLDIVVEPTVGILSDRTRRAGPRKPWIVGGLPVLMLGVLDGCSRHR